MLLGGAGLFAATYPLLPHPGDPIVVDARTLDDILEREADGLGRDLTPDERTARVERHVDEEIGEFELPSIDAVRTERPRVPVASLVLVLLASGLGYAGSRPGRSRAVRRVALVRAVSAYALYPFARVSAEVPLIVQRSLSTERAGEVVEGLLANVYRSFDIHNEEAIYDRLALTVTGDQLLDVYLESRTALELENRGGARVRIDEVAVRDVRSVRPTAQGGYEIAATWTVGGSVSHFGHEQFGRTATTP
jgi:hypothetical protein